MNTHSTSAPVRAPLSAMASLANLYELAGDNYSAAEFAESREGTQRSPRFEYGMAISARRQELLREVILLELPTSHEDALLLAAHLYSAIDVDAGARRAKEERAIGCAVEGLLAFLAEGCDDRPGSGDVGSLINVAIARSSSRRMSLEAG